MPAKVKDGPTKSKYQVIIVGIHYRDRDPILDHKGRQKTSPDGEGLWLDVNKVARKGEIVELEEEEAARLLGLEAIAEPGEVENLLGEESIANYGQGELEEWVSDNKVATIVSAAENDPSLAQRILDIENEFEEPRKTLIGQLDDIIEEDDEEEEEE